MTLLVFQVSYIYSLAVFEDYLYATHSDPSKGSSSVELLQIHRFNITEDSRILASLGNTKRLRVYHKLVQPQGKGSFLARLTCASMCQNYPRLVTQKPESQEYRKRTLQWLIMISLSVWFCPQSGVTHVKWAHTESRAVVPISAFWVAATSPEPADVVPATVWALMGSPVKVSNMFCLGSKYVKPCVLFFSVQGFIYLFIFLLLVVLPALNKYESWLML